MRGEHNRNAEDVACGRRVEMSFTNVVFCKFMVSDICTIDLLNQLLKLFKIEKQIKQDL